MITKSVRGATCLKKDSKDEMIKAVNQLVSELFKKNRLNDKIVVSIIFSVTKDLKKYNPAAALRNNGFASIPLFCTQEPYCRGGLKKVVRVIISFNTEIDSLVCPIYINGAQKLRPDLV